MQAAIQTLKICRNCHKSDLQNRDNILIRICIPKGTDKHGFESCEEFQDKQCTLCKYEKLDATDERCQLCFTLSGKPYFERRVIENG